MIRPKKMLYKSKIGDNKRKTDEQDAVKMKLQSIWVSYVQTYAL